MAICRENSAFSTTSANNWLTTKSTSDLAEGSNLYFTDARARKALSETITGIDYDDSTGVFSLTSGYTIPLTASTTEWDTAYAARITSASAPLSIANHVLSISQADGVALKAVLPVSARMFRHVGVERDSALDNGIVAHEWGHYLHHRLAACGSQQCRAQSAGVDQAM